METDLGVQAERTALAWRRTSLALFVVSIVLLRWIGRHGWIVLVPMAFALFRSLMSANWLDVRYQRKLQGLARERIEPDIAMILLMTGSLLILASVIAYIVLLSD